MLTQEEKLNLHQQILPLFSQLDEALIELLQGISKEAWQTPTTAGKWTVKDLAAHLLDGNIKGIATSRDAHFIQPSKLLNSYEAIVSFINEINHVWIKAAERMSDKLLISLLSITGTQYQAHLATLNPIDEAVFA
ncbi:MAG: maleylpyruvate isomerase N-terminal domain-containing protein, partial [Chitinophagaceae bacterium]